MSHAENKVNWCLKKAERESEKGDKHRGLKIIKPDLELVNAHIKKAEHNIKAITDFKRFGYSDWSASAAFYSIYHCFLAIITKFGFESRNQECTFALVYHLIETDKIKLDKKLVEQVQAFDTEEKHESSSIIEVRESEQYGVKLSLEDEIFARILTTARIILDRTKEIIEE